MYAAAGQGESTTDLAWDGQALVHENGEKLAEGERFSPHAQLVTADVDLRRLSQERTRMTSFLDSAHDHRERLRGLRRIPVELTAPRDTVLLRREIPRFPYVPADPRTLDERCAEVHQIQVQGLTRRLAATGTERVVIGVSGGLDSTHALMVAVRSMDRLGLPRGNVLAFSLPGFATSERTRRNAHRLMAALGVTAGEIDIRPSATQMLRDLGHPAAEGARHYDVTYENVQAGERTSHLFRLANQRGGLVVGTGDLSEIALGWSTYGVGDQMSHYNVNASVPKTLVQHLLRWAIDSGEATGAAAAALESILDTAISPELVPSDARAADQPAQSSEAVVGPFELQDFHLYHLLRFGYRPSRIAYLAHHAWCDRARGSWPSLIPENKLLEDAGIAIDPHTNGAFVDENLQTNMPGVFSAGNVLHVHDLVDFVSMESEALARHAAAYVEGKGIDPCTLDVKCGEGVGHTIPQKVSGKNDFSLSLRVRNHYRDCRIVVRQNGVEVAAKKMKKAIPAEMIQFKVSAAKLQETGALEVSVE